MGRIGVRWTIGCGASALAVVSAISSQFGIKGANLALGGHITRSRSRFAVT